jgi:hypothetical protein
VGQAPAKERLSLSFERILRSNSTIALPEMGLRADGGRIVLAGTRAATQPKTRALCSHPIVASYGSIGWFRDATLGIGIGVTETDWVFDFSRRCRWPAMVGTSC